jgi:hypothetical protein
MAGKKKVDEDVTIVDETDDSTVAEAQGTAGMEGYSKTNQLSIAMHKLAAGTPDQIAFFIKSLESMSGDGVPDGAHATNKASIAAKGAIAEDLAAIFGDDETITEAFKSKVTTIFESAVDMRVDEIRVDLEERFTADLTEAVSKIEAEFKADADAFFDYCAEDYIEKNKLAVEKSLRADIAENILDGIYNVFTENFIKVPDEKVDIADALSEEVEDLQVQNNALLEANIALGEKVKEYAKRAAIAEAIDGMTEVQADKFIKLAENIEFDGDLEKFNTKLGVIKESNFVKAAVVAKSNLTIDESVQVSDGKPEVKAPAAKAPNAHPEVNAILAALRRNSNR